MGLRALSKGIFKGGDMQPYLHLPQSNPLRLPWDIGGVCTACDICASSSVTCRGKIRGMPPPTAPAV